MKKTMPLMGIWMTIQAMLAIHPPVVLAGNTETFSYRDTNEDREIFGPEDWDRVGCDDLGQCAGWPDTWELGYDWRLDSIGNSCRWCPQGSSSCGNHHQSPIDLERIVAVKNQQRHSQCIDEHWMKYEDGTCDNQQLSAAGAYTIERFALRVALPYEEYTGPGPGELPFEEYFQIEFQPACTDRNGNFHRWPRIDFSKGFGHWWFLSHTDVKIPSEHTQNGKRYSAEVQLYHFYSKSRLAPPDENGDAQENEMAAVSIFLEVYDDAPPYPHLDRLICEWRRTEDIVREACGMDSVDVPYPGCFNPNRGQPPAPAPVRPDPTAAPADPTAPTIPLPGGAPTAAPYLVLDFPFTPAPDSTAAPATPTSRRRLRQASTSTTTTATSTTTVMDKVTQLDEQHDNAASAARDAPGGARRRRVALDEANFRPPEMTDEEWLEFAEAKSAHDRGAATPEQRQLLAGQHLSFHNYQWMIDVKTEYYFRYQGTQTIPPCHGKLVVGGRYQTNHWRIMKDPIRIHARQLEEMSRLIRDRIDPDRCRSDTAAKVERDGSVNIARPLMELNYHHFMVFCECFDFTGFGWSSKWPEDREWCRSQDRDQDYRFFQHPYNFFSEGQF